MYIQCYVHAMYMCGILLFMCKNFVRAIVYMYTYISYVCRHVEKLKSPFLQNDHRRDRQFGYDVYVSNFANSVEEVAHMYISTVLDQSNLCYKNFDEL